MLSRAILVACVCVAAGGAGESAATRPPAGGNNYSTLFKYKADSFVNIYVSELSYADVLRAAGESDVVPGAAAKIHGNN